MSARERVVLKDLHLDGMSPQKVIRVMNGIIGKQKKDDKAQIRIEEYEETYGNPFEQNPDKCLRVVVYKKLDND